MHKKQKENNLTDIRNYVSNLLENYQNTIRKIALLRYELEHPQGISADEMIAAMNFVQGDGMPSAAGNISNKTLYIAMNYQQEAARLNSETMDAITSQLIPLEHEIDRLHHYLELLDERQSMVIRLYYFERKPWEAIGDELSCTPRTAQNLRREAVEALVQMYAFTHGILK